MDTQNSGGLGHAIDRSDLLTQDAPRHIGPQLLALDGLPAPARLALDDGAELGRYLPVALKQLADELGTAIYCACESRSAAPTCIDGSFDVLVHTPDSIKQCCMLHPALHDRKPGRDNQAMLDRRRSSELLKESLHEAFKAWSALDPKNHTKAELARRAENMRPGYKCSPQTVNGWFTTGRMDKGWIRLVGHILEKQLNFDGIEELPEAGTDGVEESRGAATAETVQAFSQLLVAAPTMKRRLALAALQDLDTRPELTAEILSEVTRLLGDPLGESGTQEPASASLRTKRA